MQGTPWRAKKVSKARSLRNRSGCCRSRKRKEQRKTTSTTKRSAMRIPRTRRGEAYFSLFSHLFEKETAVMTHSIAPRGRNEGGIFFLLPHNESNVRWHPVLESFAVPLTNGSGFSDGWAIVFGWAVFIRIFDARLPRQSLIVFTYSSSVLECASSWLAPAWSEAKRSV